MRRISIDGRQLSYPGTGQALIAAEFVRHLLTLADSSYISIFVDSAFHPEEFDLDRKSGNWIPIDFVRQYSKATKLLAKAVAVNDYVERQTWGNLIANELKKNPADSRHFIPYCYNYGNVHENVVFIPDLIDDSLPILDPSKPWIWNIRHQLPLKSWLRAYEKRLAGDARQIIVSSDFVRGQVETELKIPSERITVIPYAVPSWLDNASDSSQDAINKIKFRLPDRFVLYAGGFGTRKNIPMLIRLAGKLHEIDPSFRMVLIGLTPELLESALGTTMRDELAIRHAAQAIVLPGYLSYKDLASVIRLSAFAVYPSHNEGFGLPVIEAAACSKLCLVGDNSSLKEVQSNRDLRIDAPDEPTWLKKILFYWQNSETATAVGKQAFEAAKRYSWQKSAAVLWEILQS